MVKMWIDDIRPKPNEEWHHMKNSSDAIKFIKLNGMPDIISFDHDLGDDDTSMKIINFIINSYLDNKLQINDNFTYFVHSANPVGSQNIRSKLDNFLKHIRNQ